MKMSCGMAVRSGCVQHVPLSLFLVLPILGFLVFGSGIGEPHGNRGDAISIAIEHVERHGQGALDDVAGNGFKPVAIDKGLVADFPVSHIQLEVSDDETVVGHGDVFGDFRDVVGVGANGAEPIDDKERVMEIDNRIDGLELPMDSHTRSKKGRRLVALLEVIIQFVLIEEVADDVDDVLGGHRHG